MSDSPQNPAAVRRNLRQPRAPSSLSLRLRTAMPAMRKQQARGLTLTSVLCLLVWSGYNTTIYYSMDPLFPKNFINFVHGVRAFFPILAGVIAACQLAQRRSLPKWLAFSPLIRCWFTQGSGWPLPSSFLPSLSAPLIGRSSTFL